MNCEYCDKRGVPIFPVRYGVTLPNTGAPQPTNKPSIEIPAAGGQYALRLLRSGYLYVYDEARKRWDDYFVTPDGYFFKTSTQAKGLPPVLPKKPFNCPDIKHRAIASCITIPDAKRATNVWLAFSDVQWTDDVRHRQDSADYRKKHMRCVDVKAYSASVDAKHCLPIKEAGSKITEYALDKTAIGRACGFSPFPLNSRKGQADQLVTEAEGLTPGKGFIVALADPVGIAAELSALMIQQASNFANDGKHKHPLMSSMAIAQIKQSVEMQAVEAEIQASEKMANEYLAQPDLLAVFSESAQKRREEQYESLRTVTPAEAKRAQANEWKKYSKKFNEPAMQSWQKQFETESKQFDDTIIQPLAKAYLGWLDSQAMKRTFLCHYDENHLDSGEVYTRTALLAMAGSLDKKACLEAVTNKLSGNFEAENFLLNATVLNQKTLKEQVQKAVGATSIDPRIFPADAYIGFQGAVADKLANGETGLNAYLLAVSAPMVKLFDTISDKVARPLWSAVAMHSRKVFVQIEVTGSKKAFRTRLIKELLKQNGQVLNPHEMQRAVSAQLRNLEFAGVPLEASEKKIFTLLLDPKQIRGMPPGLPASQQASWLAASIRTPAQLDNIVLGEWKAVLSRAKGSIPFVGALLAAIWQWKALDKLGEDEQKAMSNEAQEATWRLRAGTAALAGTIIDAAGQGVQKSISLVPKFGQGLETLGIWFSRIGRGAGLIGAFIMAGFDAKNMIDAYKKRDWTMAGLYFASASLGVIVGVLAFLGAIPFIGWLAIIALIGVTLLIELFKDNKVQAWLENGYWGQRQYKKSDEEMKQLELAVAG